MKVRGREEEKNPTQGREEKFDIIECVRAEGSERTFLIEANKVMKGSSY